MRQMRSVALVGMGKIAASCAGRLPRLATHLGPVQASSLRVASRMVNLLRAGYPVIDAEAFADSRMILVCVPDAAVDRWVSELDSARIDWRNRIVILADSMHDSHALLPLAERGALTASINPLHGIGDDVYIAEGSKKAIDEFRRTLLPASARVVRLNGGGKPLFLAAVTLAALPVYVGVAAGECLRAAGIPVRQSRAILRTLMMQAVRGYVKAGVKATGSEWDSAHWTALRRQVSALHIVRPQAADFLVAVLSHARKIEGREWKL